jgi:hypothetical protein
MDPIGILSISAVSLVVLALTSWIVTGTIISPLIIISLAALVGFILKRYGVFSYSVSNTGVDLQFHENSPSPHENKETVEKTLKPIETKEVFFVEGQYSYADAPAVCSAYGGELASYDQLTDAFSKGAEWCSYGWSAGAMALYPTQQSTWSALQAEPQESKRTACGRPGVNGGYFDPKLKFGVNCYGIKPQNHGMKFPQPLPTDDPKSFDKMVDKFKKMLPMKLTGFNRDIWSEAGIPGQMKKDVSAVADSIDNDISAIWKSL